MLCLPSVINETMDDKTKLLNPLPHVSKRIIEKKLVDHRDIIWCPFDYIRRNKEYKINLTEIQRKNLKSVFDIFYEKVDSPATSSTPSTKESKRSIEEEEEEENKEKRKKCKMIRKDIKKIKYNATSPVKKKLGKKGGITTVHNALLRLTTPSEKVLNNENLSVFYIRGIEKNEIPLIKQNLNNIGIKSEYIENISFIIPDITKIVEYKSYEK